MKKIFTLCMAVTLLAACNNNDDSTPIYGNRANVPTVDAAQDAIDQGSSRITITTPLTEDASLTIPTGYENESLTITVPANGNSLTISQGPGSAQTHPALDLNITDAKDLAIDTPDMTVIVNGNVQGTLTASTADNTLIISAASTINTLVVQKGNVRLLGAVTTLGSVASTSKILYPVSTAAELQARMTETPYNNKTNGGVVFTADISYVVPADQSIDGTPAISGIQANQDAFRVGFAPTEGQPETPYNGYIIDGNGFSLSGAAYNNVLAIYANDVTVRNLTIRQTAEQKANKIAKNGTAADAINAGISIYGVEDVRLVNVTVENCGKYGVVVNGSIAAATNLTSRSNGWGGVNVANGSGMADRPLSFTLNSGSISDTYAIVQNTATATVSVPSGWTSQTADGVTLYSPPATN